MNERSIPPMGRMTRRTGRNTGSVASVQEDLHTGQGGPGLHAEPAQESHRQHDQPEVQFDDNSSQAENIHNKLRLA